MKVRFDEEKIINIRNIVISEKEADILLKDLEKAIKTRKSSGNTPKIRLGACLITISNLIEGN